MRPTLALTAFALLLSVAPAAAASHRDAKCSSLKKLKADDSVTIRALTRPEYHFMQGIWAMAPQTPEGLPPGDSAILVTSDESKTVGMVMFATGDLVCKPMLGIPLDLLAKVRAGKVGEGDDL